MKIGIIGTGYVGLPSGVGFAELGNRVICVDKDEDKIASLKSGKITIFEDGLEDLFYKNIQNKNLQFTSSMKEGVEGAEYVGVVVVCCSVFCSVVVVVFPASEFKML